MKKKIKILVIILLVIYFNSCDDFYMTDSRIKTVNNDDPVQEQEVTDPIPNQEYINSETMHVPNSIIGTYTIEQGTWTISNNGISQPVNCSLFPNPFESSVFLDNGGETKEIIGDGYYYFYGCAWFEYNGKVYEGSVILNIIRDGNTSSVNGYEAK